MASELDAKVAECLGWTERSCGSWVDKDGYIQIVCGFFEPSTDHEACYAVKQAILSRKWRYEIMAGHGSVMCCVSEINDTEDHMVIEHADTEYEAVCKAFVAACGREGTA